MPPYLVLLTFGQLNRMMSSVLVHSARSMNRLTLLPSAIDRCVMRRHPDLSSLGTIPFGDSLGLEIGNLL